MRKKQLPPIQKQEIETKAIYNLTGGWNDNSNQLELSDSEISDGRNVILGNDSLWTGRGGIQQKGNYIGPTGDILQVYEFYRPTTGVRYVLGVYNTDIYLLTSGEWILQSQTLTTGKKASFTTGNDRAYMANGYDEVQKFTGAAWSELADFPVSSAAATDIPNGLTFFLERIIGWNTTTHPNRIYYSNQALETIGALNYFDTPGPVKCCIPFADEYMLVFTEDHIYRLDYFVFTGAQYDPDQLKEMAIGEGAVSQRSVIKIGSYVYYVSNSGFMRTDATAPVNISDDKIKNFFGTLNKAYLSSAASGRLGNLWYIAVSVDGTTNDRVVIYDTVKNIWYPPFDGKSISCFETITESGVQSLIGADDGGFGQAYSFNNTNIYDEEANTEYTADQDADSAITAATTVRKAQSFQVDEDYLVTSVEALLKKVSGTTTGLTVRIETDSSSKPSGTLVSTNATTTITAFTGTAYTYKKATFDTPFTLTADTTYWIVIQHTTEATGDSAYAWGSDDSSPAYASGNLATYAAAAWTADATKDLLFRVNVEERYDKYITTKGFYLSDPQKDKKVRKVFNESIAIGNWFQEIGINTDLYSTYVDFSVNLLGNSPLRAAVTRGDFTRGTQSKVKEFLEPDDIRGKMIKLRYYNENINENFKVVGSVIDFQTINLLR